MEAIRRAPWALVLLVTLGKRHFNLRIRSENVNMLRYVKELGCDFARLLGGF